MASTYFSWIRNELYSKEHDEELQLYEFQLYEFDIEFLEFFCLCLKAWDYNADEQSKECLTSIITHFKLIWVQEDNSDLQTWPKDIQDFDPVAFGLEVKIQQSKTLIEQWCQILVRRFSSMQIKCKSLTNLNIMDFVISVHFNLCNLLWYRASEIDPFKYQIDILKEMLQILDTLSFRVGGCIDSNELHEYRNFVHALSYNVACLIFMYWTKEANEENATEMNVSLLDMLHKIKPCAAHVTASYFAVLKFNNLLQSEDSVSQGQTLTSFVDFFFEHTTLKNDFPILRERLILLFRFLTDDPRDNAQGEEDEIRSQIYALFHDKKMLQSDLMNKIEILNANILQLYYRPSDSLNRLEAEKMSNIYFASLQRELLSFKHHPQVHLYLMEINFLRLLFFPCFEAWDDSDEETRVRLRSVVTSLQRIWGHEYDMVLLSSRLYTIRIGAISDWEYLLDLELKEKFHASKEEINAWLISWSHCSFHCRPSTSSKILKLLDSILYNMNYLVDSGACKDHAFKKQIEILEEKLLFLNNLLKNATNCAYSKNLEKFNMLAQVLANNAACLIYVYWAKEANDEIPAKTNLMLKNMLQKIKPNTPDVARIYFGTLKAICLQPYDSLLLEQTVKSFVDYFFEDLTTPWKNDFQILRDEVNFYLTFVHHHHTGNAGEIICIQLDVLFSDVAFDLLPFDDMKLDISKKKVGLSDLMKNIGTENAKIRHLFCKFPDSFLCNFPRIIGRGFLDSLIQKHRKLTEKMISDQKFVTFAKYQFKTIGEELVSLTPIFNQILELTDLNDTWLEVVNVAYLAEHVISLCFIFYRLNCYYIPYVSDVIDRIKAVRTKIGNILECKMYIGRCLPHSIGFKSTLLERDQTSEIPAVVVGFEEDEEIIIDNITRGTESFDIVSIVGMGGLGKTTLAKKIYGSSSVKSHFNICAFTYVSQDHDKRRILLDILRYVDGVDDNTSDMTADDLAHKLKKCLSRKKYFIVLDDIWNINAWHEVRSSFPDNQNGSRVMFTTRSLEVAKRCQINCSPHCLRFLTEDESLKLLQMKVFYNDMPPPKLSGVLELVAKKCNGLPLAIVLIAGVLARTETSLWIEISVRVSSYLFDEGCMDILELSYNHLPEYLKPCLLYFGAFPEDGSYKVRQVILLWIAEGFIKESETKNLNDVAKEYLDELVDRSLIVVDKISTSDIRTFRVHDLVHDFCQKKCVDKNFFQLGHGTSTSSFSAPLKYNHYRVSVQKLYNPSLTNTRSVLCFPLKFDYYQRILPLCKFRFAKVLYLKGIRLQVSDFAHATSLIDLRHIEAEMLGNPTIPSSISNLWNIQSLILKSDVYYLPETIWRMKSLRYVKVHDCKFEVLDGYELNAYPQLDKVVRFSRPYLSTGKDVKWLLQRLPAVRELSCILDCKSVDSVEERVETLDFHSELESLKLWCGKKKRPCFINFPSTLVKLTLARFLLPWSVISAIAELQNLVILKLRYVYFPGRTWEMKDVTFPKLEYFELHGSTLKLWNANIDSFPCMEQLYFHSTLLEELPASFGEISSLKKITISGSSKLKKSALEIQKEQMEFGNIVEIFLNFY